MSSDEPHFTYNFMTNDDKELLFRNGYRPNELSAQEARELLADLRTDEDDSRLRSDIPDDEKDDT